MTELEYMVTESISLVVSHFIYVLIITFLVFCDIFVISY